jgi:hypothetical protein
MKQRAHRWRRQDHDDLNRGDYRGDFGPDGEDRFPRATDGGRESWRRGRVSGGFGSQFAAWRSGAGFAPAGFGFGPAEDPGRDEADESDIRSTRGRGAWAGDWTYADYRGRGPRDYRRSDDRLREEVCDRLTDDWAVDATGMTVQVQDGEVTLAGTVPSRQQKRRAAEIVEQIAGVQDVFNQLAVSGGEPPSWRPGSR